MQHVSNVLMMHYSTQYDLCGAVIMLRARVVPDFGSALSCSSKTSSSLIQIQPDLSS